LRPKGFGSLLRVRSRVAAFVSGICAPQPSNTAGPWSRPDSVICVTHALSASSVNRIGDVVPSSSQR